MSKVAAVETLVVNVSPRTNWTFVAVTTDDGETGWGECSLNRWEPLLVASVDMLSGDVCGHTLEAAFDTVRYVPHSPGGLAMHAAKSAVEQALTDLRAQHAALPVHAIIGGGSRKVIPAYANINRGISARSPAGFAAAARAALAVGYRNIKIAPFDGVIAQDAASSPIDALIQAGLDRVYAVRDAIGRDRVLMVDCHWRFDEPRATALIRDLHRQSCGDLWPDLTVIFDIDPAIGLARSRLDPRGHEHADRRPNGGRDVGRSRRLRLVGRAQGGHGGRLRLHCRVGAQQSPRRHGRHGERPRLLAVGERRRRFQLRRRNVLRLDREPAPRPARARDQPVREGEDLRAGPVVLGQSDDPGALVTLGERGEVRRRCAGE